MSTFGDFQTNHRYPSLLTKANHKSNSFLNGNITSVCKKQLKKLILSHIIIHSLKNKFDLLIEQIKGDIDVLTISENKQDLVLMDTAHTLDLTVIVMVVHVDPLSRK